jgi:hypothetical protein
MDLSVFGVPLFALIGFSIAAYAIVGNDVIQTLGTFLASNAKRSWILLWGFAMAIFVAVMAYGWFFNGGDVAFGRLNSIPYPENGVQWWHVLPAVALLFLTRFGIPVSTTFLVLTIFTLTGGAATEGVLGDILLKSLIGYVVAFAAGAVVFLVIARVFEKWVFKTRDQNLSPVWYAAQWGATAFLWSQWLMQDLANIFVFLPRETIVAADGSVSVTFSLGLVVFATVLMVGLHAIMFAIRGGEIQKIVLNKTNTVDVRSATVVDLIFGLVLLYFKEMNDVPMSTTWVFLGLLAGRELAISYVASLRNRGEAMADVTKDAARAGVGLAVSVILAVGLPFLATGIAPNLQEQMFGPSAAPVERVVEMPAAPGASSSSNPAAS